MAVSGLSPTIEQIRLVDEIEELSAKYKTRHGRLPVNISHWDPSQQLTNKLRRSLPISEEDPISYHFSYQVDCRAALLRKLGILGDNISSLITENGSTAVTAVANWLALSGVCKIIVLTPCYFTIPYRRTQRIEYRHQNQNSARHEPYCSFCEASPYSFRHLVRDG
jgi:hypothetical protein